MFDTHCHLNFSRFKSVTDVMLRAQNAGVAEIVVPGTDLATSKKAIELARSNKGIHAAVGIHPHHAYEIRNDKKAIDLVVEELEKLVKESGVVAIGEVGLDKHQYQRTKYEDYKIDEVFFETQLKLLKSQIDLAKRYDKAIILHNREATDETLKTLEDYMSSFKLQRVVFHCCEPDDRLLDFAKKHNIFIGVDGDVTYDAKKREFVARIPLSLLVFETDSPYLLPEPLRSQKKFPNEPCNIPLIASYVSSLRAEGITEIRRQTYENSIRLFLPEKKG